MKSSIRKSSFIATVFALIASFNTWATPVLFGNSYYEVIAAPQISWNDANQQALVSSYLGEMGYLATLTSQDENDFVFSLLAPLIGTNEAWIGGFQPENSQEPLGGWQWVNNEGLLADGYTNWLGGEPNDNAGFENFLALGLFGNNGWNDEGDLGLIGGYVIEYDATPVTSPTSLILFSLFIFGLLSKRSIRKF